MIQSVKRWIIHSTCESMNKLKKNKKTRKTETDTRMLLNSNPFCTQSGLLFERFVKNPTQSETVADRIANLNQASQI